MKKLLSIILSISLLVSMVTVSSAANSISTTASDLSVVESKIPKSESPFSFTVMDDSENNVVDMKIDESFLNDNENAKLYVSKADSKNPIYNGVVTATTVKLNGIETDAKYNYNITIENNLTVESYIGAFSIVQKSEDIVYVYSSDVFKEEYAKGNNIRNAISTLENDVVISENINKDNSTYSVSAVSSTRYEAESNNTMSLADRMYDDDTMYGKIGSSGDVDWYKILIEEHGNANFWLGDIPAGQDYDMFLYNASGTLLESSETTNDQEQIYEFEVSADTWYYVKIIGYGNSADANNYYRLRIKNYPTEDDHGDTFSTATNISVGNSVLGVIDFGGDNDYFKFTATQSGLFTIKTTGNTDTYGYLYNNSQSQLKSNDDGDDTNFKIVYRLTSGATYYIRVKAYSSSETGSYTLSVTAGDDYADNFNGTLTALTVNSSKSGSLDDASDIDCFKFIPTVTGSYKIYTTGSTDTSGMLYKSDKITSIGTSNSSPEGNNFKLARTLQANQTYYIRVSSNSTTSYGDYSIVAKRISEPNDPQFVNQWGLLNRGNNGGEVGIDINVLPVWEYTKGDGVTIAIVDTGINTAHSDLSNSISPSYAGYNFVHQNTTVYNSNELINPQGWLQVAEDSDDESIRNEYWRRYYCMDVNGHGTHVAGIVAANQNAVGLSGVAPEAEIIPLKVLGMPVSGGTTYNDDIFNLINAVEYIDDNNIDIANMSIAYWGLSANAITELENSMENASNTLFVVAAGNNGINLSSNSLYYPACANVDNMIVVANLTNEGELSVDSNYGGNTNIAAPGSLIYSTLPSNGYGYMSGTSMAAPHVAGAAALLKSYYSNLTPLQIKQRLVSGNNVTYNSELSGKVSSNGHLNVWYAFCSDSTTPRTASGDTADNEQSIKARIIAMKNDADIDSFTTKMFVNIADGVDKLELIASLVPQATVVKTMQLTGSLVIEFDSVESVINAVDLLNSNEYVNYAEPVYNTKLSIG